MTKQTHQTTKENKKKSAMRVIIFAIVIVMAFAAIIWPFIIYADEVTDLKDDLSDINNDIAALEKKISQGKSEANTLSKEIKTVENKVYSVQKQINVLTEKVNDTKEKISIALDELNKKQAEMDEQNRNLNARLRAMYKNGDVSMLSVLFNSASISDFLTNLDLIKRIYESDKNLLESMEADYQVIVEKKQALSDLKTDLVNQQNALKENKAALAESEAALEKQKSAIEKNNKQLEAQVDALNAEADRLVDEILKLQGGGDYLGGAMCWPAKASTRITSPFGYRMHPILKVNKLHTGIDIGASYGTDILAANSGKVITAAYNANGYGYYIMIDHGGGIVTLYGHSSKLLVNKGDVVTRGQVIAKVGSTGMSTGSHLHFEVRINGKYTNPLEYVTPGKF